MPNSFWVYILKCSDGSYYTGSTNNLERRINEHNFKKYKGYTSSRLPVELVYSQKFDNPNEAISAERQIKGWSRKKKEALIKGDFDELVRLSHTSTSSV